MGLMDILRKLGILRSGATSYCGDLKDRPADMNLDEIFEERRDFGNQGNIGLKPKEKE